MDASSVAASRRAAELHARTVAAGPPRSTRWTVPAAAVAALGAAVTLPLFGPAAFVLVALAVLLLAVHRSDRRNAWRYASEPFAPARFLPPLRAVELAHVVDSPAPAEPTEPATLVHVPNQVVLLPSVPRSRVSIEGSTRPLRAARPPKP